MMTYVFLIINLIGIGKIAFDSFVKIRERKFNLDYVAALALIVSFFSHEYIAGSVVTLMLLGGAALEVFAERRAYSSLKELSDTIPKNCTILENGIYKSIPLQEVESGTNIIVKANELVPLDGIIISPSEAIFNMSNLTGESVFETIYDGTLVKSGAINMGETVTMKTVGDFSTSTYRKIISLVEEAKENPSDTVLVAEKVNIYFTIFTLIFAGLAYFISGSLFRVLSVLVIATPCPLLIAAPVAFIGGMSKLAKQKIIIRKPSSLEKLDKANTIFFDKTGTLTIGEPAFRGIEIVEGEKNNFTENDVISICAGLEIHSLHPLAHTIVAEAKKKNANFVVATNIKEIIGKGISGEINGNKYSIFRHENVESGIVLSFCKNDKEVAKISFSDILKDGAVDFLNRLIEDGKKIAVITGDHSSNAQNVFRGVDIKIYAEKSPEEKFNLINEARKNGEIIVMLGDGLNDAPAIARADVGIVFSGTENGASIGAADVVILDHRIEKIDTIFKVSKRTMNIVKQSIYTGMGLSLVGMIVASMGFIHPVLGAFIQEAIDITVILNALRVLI